MRANYDHKFIDSWICGQCDIISSSNNVVGNNLWATTTAIKQPLYDLFETVQSALTYRGRVKMATIAGNISNLVFVHENGLNLILNLIEMCFHASFWQ